MQNINAKKNLENFLILKSKKKQIMLGNINEKYESSTVPIIIGDKNSEPIKIKIKKSAKYLLILKCEYIFSPTVKSVKMNIQPKISKFNSIIFSFVNIFA